MGISLKGRYPTQVLEPTPAPNHYYPKSEVIHKSSPQFTMGNKNYTDTINTNPSAADYEPNFKVLKTTAPAISLSGRHEQPISNQTPGPGHYNVQHSDTGIKSSLGQKMDGSKIEDGPAPNMYDPKRPTSAPAFTIGERYSVQGGQRYPGPAAYSP